MLIRPRRNRASSSIRRAFRETTLGPQHLVLPLFLQEGERRATPIASMPGCARLSIDRAVELAGEADALGLMGVELFPALDDRLKDPRGRESLNPEGLMQRAIRAIKKAHPRLCVFTDVALDPYSSDGHDGVVIDGRIDNDQTLPLLAAMSVSHAAAGADIVAPSDMMDGRVEAIRHALDEAGHTQVGILSYCVKYASAFYGPFREALDSAPRAGDKKTYQMDPGNVREAQREVQLDEAEGADILMVKPATLYTDVIRYVRELSSVPIAAYHVSGEFSMLKAAAQNGWLDYERCLLETLLSLRRAGTDIIFTYGALDAARALAKSTD